MVTFNLTKRKKKETQKKKTMMMMAPTKTAISDTFSFLALPLEIRRIIYQLVFAQRSVILTEHLVCEHRIARSRQPFYRAVSKSEIDGTINLLRTCKKIHAEAQPLLSMCVPSHLVLSRDLWHLPTHCRLSELEHYLCLPLRYITKLSLDVKCLGENEREVSACPKLMKPASLSRATLPPTRSVSLDPEVDGLPPEPKRLPGIGGIRKLSVFSREGLPALREVHIYDALKGCLDPPQDPCSCPIALTESCHCGKRKCACIAYQPYPQLKSLSLTETASEMHSALHNRYRALFSRHAQSMTTMGWHDYFAVLSLLVHGVYVYLHDAIPVSVSMECGKAIHKGCWRAKFCLRPPEGAQKPANPPAESVESLRQLRMSEYRGVRARLLPDGPESKNSTTKLLWNLEGSDISEFEAGLEVQVMDEQVFDRVVDRESREFSEQLKTADKDKSLWVWDCHRVDR